MSMFDEGKEKIGGGLEIEMGYFSLLIYKFFSLVYVLSYYLTHYTSPG